MFFYFFTWSFGIGQHRNVNMMFSYIRPLPSKHKRAINEMFIASKSARKQRTKQVSLLCFRHSNYLENRAVTF